MSFLSPKVQSKLDDSNFLSTCNYSTICLFKTDNYSWFKRYDKNREISRSNVSRLKKSIRWHNFLQHDPILVSIDGYVIDGQHRLEACKELGEPVYFVVYPSRDFGEIIQALNSAQEKWTAANYVHFHDDKDEVQFIQKLQKMTGVSAHILLKLFCSNVEGRKKITSMGESFTRGIEVSLDRDDIMDFCHFYMSIRGAVLDDPKHQLFLKSTGFFSALWYLYNHEMIDRDRLHHVITTRIHYIKSHTAVTLVRVNILTQYNRNRPTKNMIAFNPVSGLIAGKIS